MYNELLNDRMALAVVADDAFNLALVLFKLVSAGEERPRSNGPIRRVHFVQVDKVRAEQERRMTCYIESRTMVQFHVDSRVRV